MIKRPGKKVGKGQSQPEMGMNFHQGPFGGHHSGGDYVHQPH